MDKDQRTDSSGRQPLQMAPLRNEPVYHIQSSQIIRFDSTGSVQTCVLGFFLQCFVKIEN